VFANESADVLLHIHIGLHECVCYIDFDYLLSFI